MSKIIYIGIFCLLSILDAHSQITSNQLYDNMSPEECKEYCDEAKFFLQNTYYNQVAEAISRLEIHKYIIEDLMLEKTIKYQPEWLLREKKYHFLSPSQYLLQINREFSGINSDELEFVVDRITYGEKLEPYSVSSCYLRLEYDLAIKHLDKMLLKRRCRMLCLFPQAIYKSRIKVLQIEPIADIYLPDSSNNNPLLTNSPSNADRYKEAMVWYDQQLKEKYMPVFKGLAEQGYTEAEWRYAICLQDEQMNNEAIYWLERAVKKNHAKAQNTLGYCYEYGLGVAKNDEKAVEWYRKSAIQGYAKGEFNLGHCYYKGIGLPSDSVKAAEWIIKSAEQGYDIGQVITGAFYYDTNNYTEAVKWYRKAAEQGNMIAQFYLGNCYYRGEGVSQSYTEAAKWYQKAAEQGYDMAQLTLGLCHQNGEGIPKNYEKAAEWYKKAAEQGNITAQSQLGGCYSLGLGLPQNYTKAAEWYEKAAKQGDAYAQYCLGNSFYYGNGVPQDYKKAIEWYQKAAEQGDIYAQYNLGNCYEYGKGTKENKSMAIKWYRKAALAGSTIAQSALQRLEK